MKKAFKISVPEPCSQSWEQMTPNDIGRFCDSCMKTVVDFTAMKTPDIQNYFSQNTGSKICGRFENKQLETLTISIPAKTIFSQTQFRKVFLLALFVTMGTSLFSCSNGNGDRQAIDKIEVTDESNSKHTLGMPLPPKVADSTSESTTPKKNIVRFVKITETVKGEVELKQPKKDSVEFLTGMTYVDTIN